MDSDAPFAEPEPDLAQLLVLEAGRIIEDLTPELASRLPAATPEREDAIASFIDRTTQAISLLVAAHSLSDERPALGDLP